jgi:hypothetical protein
MRRSMLAPVKKQVVELRSNTLVQAYDFTIDDRPTITRSSHCFAKFSERVERVTVAGDELGVTVLDDGQ